MGLMDDLMKSVNSLVSDGKLDLSSLKTHADKAGLGDIFDSWVGTGENKPISAEQVKQVADPEKLQEIAAGAGVSVDEAAEGLSKALPDTVDKLTPQGVLPSDAEIRSAISAS